MARNLCNYADYARRTLSDVPPLAAAVFLAMDSFVMRLKTWGSGATE
jgi:hypothetical protein